MTDAIHIHTDGGSRGNPGESGIGVYITDSMGKELASIGKAIGITTNNVAEYTAVLCAYEWLIANKSVVGQRVLCFFLDSNLVVNQVNRLFRVKNNALFQLLQKIYAYEREFTQKITYSYVPREQNKDADRLVNAALDNKLSSLVQ